MDADSLMLLLPDVKSEFKIYLKTFSEVKNIFPLEVNKEAI
jgi:hypothetical protein